MPTDIDPYSATFYVVAFVILGAPIVFLVIVALAVVQRRRTGRVGTTLSDLMAGTGGFALGSLLLLDAPLVVQLPIFISLTYLIVTRSRRGRRVQAGWLLAGAALPWTLLWGWYVALALVGVGVDPQSASARFGVGAIWLAVGLWFAWRGDPAPAAPHPAARPGQPGSRAFGSIAEAIRDAARIGPFPAPELAMLIAVVATLLLVNLVLPGDLPRLVTFAVPILAAVLVGTEGYVRAWPATSRRAFEAFSWLGEWELARARELTGEGVPTSKRAAEAWLERRPVRREEVPLRTEILLLAGRLDEARKLVADAPAETPVERFELASLRDLVDWRAGGDGDLGGMTAAAGEIVPADGDDRLRAEVSIATSLVRRSMAGAVPDGATAVAPLVEVRERLGARADGQIGRALRRRMLPVLLVVLVVFALALELLTGRGLPGL
ncbi:MAG: hypothetical protein FIA92_06740 [Chloroflexi bacterium]|nr:hypothetical protein [Chloroflexota bacterium]